MYEVETLSLEAFQARIGQEVGVSNWHLIDQPRIDAFAEVTEDHQFIHVDPRAAAATPLGCTVAHGFLSVSMLSVMAYEALPVLEDLEMGLNYGFDRLRFLSPVPVGSKVRGRFTLKASRLRGTREVVNRYGVTMQINSSEKPALVADWLTMQVLKTDSEFNRETSQ